jgi:twitching motility protein PilU
VRAIISQRLVPALEGGRAAVLEILLDTPRIKDLIKRGQIEALKEAMEQSAIEGCQTFDSALAVLFVAGRVSAEEALKISDSPNNLRLMLERFQRSAGPIDPRSALKLAGEAMVKARTA